jgi:hypothetical protein
MTEETTPASENTLLAVVEDHNPKLVLIDANARKAMMDYAEKLVAEFVPDVTTAAGREAIRKHAAMITRTKTTLDQTAKEMTEEWRRNTALVNEQRKPLVESLKLLAERARQPLTDWEEAEERRVTHVEDTLRMLVRYGVVQIDETMEQVEARLAAVRETEIDPAVFQGATDAGTKARDHSIELLENAIARLKREAEDKAELERLRREAAERDKAEQERREAEQAKALAAEEDARRAEQERLAEEKHRQREADEAAAAERAAAEAKEREEAAAARAAEDARKEAERAAAAERERVEREAKEAQAERDRAHEAELAAERARAAEAERRERERKEQEERAAAERARLEADQERRTNAKREAKEALMTTGITEDQAKAIVLLIISNEIPRVKLDFAAEPTVKKAAREAFDDARHEEHLEGEDKPLLQKVLP